MSEHQPIPPREEIEAKLTALLLGELPADEAFALGRSIEQDAELRKTFERLTETIKLVRETEAPMPEEEKRQVPLKLSEKRREALLQSFKTVRPKEFERAAARRKMWRQSVAIAAVIAVLAGAAVLWTESNSSKKRLSMAQTDVLTTRDAADTMEGLRGRTWGTERAQREPMSSASAVDSTFLPMSNATANFAYNTVTAGVSATATNSPSPVTVLSWEDAKKGRKYGDSEAGRQIDGGVANEFSTAGQARPQVQIVLPTASNEVALSVDSFVEFSKDLAPSTVLQIGQGFFTNSTMAPNWEYSDANRNGSVDKNGRVGGVIAGTPTVDPSTGIPLPSAAPTTVNGGLVGSGTQPWYQTNAPMAAFGGRGISHEGEISTQAGSLGTVTFANSASAPGPNSGGGGGAGGTRAPGSSNSLGQLAAADGRFPDFDKDGVDRFGRGDDVGGLPKRQLQPGATLGVVPSTNVTLPSQFGITLNDGVSAEAINKEMPAKQPQAQPSTPAETPPWVATLSDQGQAIRESVRRQSEIVYQKQRELDQAQKSKSSPAAASPSVVLPPVPSDSIVALETETASAPEAGNYKKDTIYRQRLPSAGDMPRGATALMEGRAGEKTPNTASRQARTPSIANVGDVPILQGGTPPAAPSGASNVSSAYIVGYANVPVDKGIHTDLFTAGNSGIASEARTNFAASPDAKFLFELGKYDEAENKAKLALARDPSDKAARYYLDQIQDARFKEHSSNQDLVARKSMVDAQREWVTPKGGKGPTQELAKVDNYGDHRFNGVSQNRDSLRKGLTQTEDLALAPEPRPYIEAKQRLEELKRSDQVLQQRYAAGNLEKSLPKTMPVEIMDDARPATNASSSLWAKITGKPPEYESRARIKVDRDLADIKFTHSLGTQGPYDPYFIQTEFETIQSEKILGRVVKDLQLDEKWAKDGRRISTNEAIGKLKGMLDLKVQKDTSYVDIGVKDRKPDEAAQIANAIARSFKDFRHEQREQFKAEGVITLREQMTEQEKKIAEQQKVVDELQQKLKIPDAVAQAQTPALLAKNEPAASVSRSGKDEDRPLARPTAPVPTPQPEVQAVENPFSTFSLNVSDVSFKLAGASLEKGQLPDPATIRSEEFINAFDYRDPEPPPNVPVAFVWERAQYPFAQGRDLLRFSIKTAAQGREAGKPMNIVLLVDNSGSMERADRVRILRESLRVLGTQLQAQDRLSIVTFARTPHLRVDAVPGNMAGQAIDQVTGLTPEGGTNLEEGMNLAYQTALRHYLTNGVNRVVLLTDGAANLGDVVPESLKAKVEGYRKQGVALDCFGIGWEGYNDDLLEALSRNGDGRYGFINSPDEAASEFAGQLAGALHVAASDVKVQVEFNPKRVTAYRQIGYAKHQLTKEQFRDNTVDAAEIGAAEAGNALYVIQVNGGGEGPVATVRVRFRVPGTSDYKEHEWIVPYTGGAVFLEQTTPAMRLAATASAFSEWLATSPYAGEVTLDALLKYVRGVPEVYGADGRPGRLEGMIRQARTVK